MSRFKNNTIHAKIDEAIRDAEALLDPRSPMVFEIYTKFDFEFNSGHPVQIISKLLASKEPVVNIFTYRPFNPWTSAIGYFDGKDIHINVRKLPYLSHVDLVANLCHEYAHACGFTHGNNYKTEYKCKHSVPYFISENVGRWLLEMNSTLPANNNGDFPISGAPDTLFI